ncbi:MAG: hypothetical protein WED05_13255 [Candidatus Atabeyarchaeum deiterrae]
MEEEKLLGSVVSMWLKKARFQLPGYGIFATNKRLIGIEFKKAAAKKIAKYQLLATPMNAFTKGSEEMQAGNPKTLQELDEEKKDFEIGREQISKIELTKPGTFKGGRLRILGESGKEMEILIGGKKEFEHLNDLMKAFLPEALELGE